MQQQQRSFCPLSSVSAPTPPARRGRTEVKSSGDRAEGTRNGSDVHGGCASSADEEHVIQASTYALWEQLYAPARVPLTMERLLYLRLSSKGDGESNDAHGHRHCADDSQWAEALFGEIASQSGASTLSASMVPPTAFAAAAVAEPLQENEEEEEPQRVWTGGLPEGASSVAVQSTKQCTAADVERASAPTPLRGHCAFPDSPLSARPGWKAGTAAPVQAPPQLTERHQQPQTSSTKAAEPAAQDLTQMRVDAQSVSGVGSRHAPEQRRAATTISPCGTVIASISESSPSLAQCRSDGSRDVDNGGGDDRAVLLRPCGGRTTSAASPPDLVLPASTSSVSLPSATPLSPVSAAAGARKETAAPMRLERDDSIHHTDRNEEAQPRDHTWSAKATLVAPALPMHASSTSAATVRAGEEGRCDGIGNAATCRLLSERSACRDGAEESRSVVGNEEKHALAQQDEVLESCGVWERDATTTTPVRPQHQCQHRSSRDTDASVEGGGHNGDGAKLGEDGGQDNDVGFLSLTTSPAGVPEQRRSRPVGGSCAGSPTPSPVSIGVLEDIMTALVISVPPNSFKSNEEAGCQLDSPTRRRIVTGVSTSVNASEDLNGLVFSPLRLQLHLLPTQRRRPRQPSEKGEEEHSHLTPVPGSSSHSSTPHRRECRPWDSQTPPVPAALFAAATPLRSSRALSPTKMADATEELCAADAAEMRDSPPLEIHMQKRKAMATVSSIAQEGRTHDTAVVNESDADPRDGTALDSPEGAPCSVEAAKDGQGRSHGVLGAPVTVGVEKARAGSKEAGGEGDARTAASRASSSRQRPSPALPDHCGSGTSAKGAPEGHAGCVSSNMENAAGDSQEEAVRAARGASASMAAAPVTRFTPAPSPPPPDSHESFCSSEHEDEHQQPQQKPLPEDKAARRSVSSMDFRWADEADDVLRRQQQRLRSLQAARTATLTGADAHRSPSTACCCPVGGPLRFAPLSQEGGVQGTHDGNGPIEGRRHGGSEATHSVSPQPQDPRAHPYAKRAMMGPGSTGVGTVASYTDSSGVVTELGGVAPSSHRAEKSKELACLTLSRSGEGGAAGTLTCVSTSPPPTAILRQPTPTAVAVATAAGNVSSLRMGPLPQQQKPSPYHAGAKRLRESHDRSDPARALRSPAPLPASVPDQTAKRKREKIDCSDDAPSAHRLRRRQRQRGDAADKTVTGTLLSAPSTNVFALPRTIAAKPGAPITAPPPTEATPLSLLRSRAVNCASAPASTTQTHKSVRGKATCTGVTPSTVTAAAQPRRENASTRAHKMAACATRHAPSLVPLRRRRDEEQRPQ
ncbi:hypothetical protein LSCM4_07519 [Leishmania orientalis]|uniref:Uncharacterized protein n=1 Tax=Leishmania orientalis TaxID=2249476 RepID=A0A836I3R6_9TRYP|nr:hypothetical protein LSCM4_07519 [Leishmania orientalis]